MGLARVGIIRLFARVARGALQGSDVTADTGGGYNLTAENMPPSGDDSRPLAGDYVALVPAPGTGRALAVGYADPDNAPKSGPGEKRIYARDATTGAEVAEIWIKSDGSILVSNGSGAVTLQTDGSIDLNGAVVDPAGNIVTTGSITASSVIANGLELAGHVHLAGTPPGTTGPNQ